MKKYLLSALCAAAFANPAVAQEEPEGPPSPNEIVEQAGEKDWVAIAPSDLMVMELAPDRKGKPRRVVIQLMPAPFSQGWVRNMRKLAAAKWYDGTAIVRVQDNYVTQWGDPDGEDASKAKPLPDGLEVMNEGDYVTKDLLLIANQNGEKRLNYALASIMARNAMLAANGKVLPPTPVRFGPDGPIKDVNAARTRIGGDAYASFATLALGWPMSAEQAEQSAAANQFWPVHCYGMVGVGRNFSPDTGSGAELYTVIGHAPRHLDRNIALVGRIIEGMEHMSSLPRGTGPLGFYENAEERTPILSVRMGDEAADLPVYEYLSTESESFARYAEARANRRDPFFIKPAGGADICNIPVPVRWKK